ncbi:MAG: carbon monoxide dehydrogenase accessory protein CooC [Candidatus Dormibacteria bacterium]
MGKSAISGTVCRHLARMDYPVLALDADTMPGMAYSIGIPPGQGRLPPGLAELVEARQGKRWKMRKGNGAARLVDIHSVRGPDGVRFLELGKLPDAVEASTTVAFRHVMERFRRDGWAVVGDLAAGTRQPMFRWSRFADFVVVVTDSSHKSLISARRLRKLGTHLVANRVRSDSDVDRISAAIDLPLLAAIPYDEDLARAEQRAEAPMDGAATSLAVEAIGELTKKLVRLERS